MTREDLLLELQKLKNEKFELEKWTVNKRGKKHMAPRLKELNTKISEIESELALIRNERREESTELKIKKEPLIFLVGDTLPKGFSVQRDCPLCGSPGIVCENPACRGNK